MRLDFPRFVCRDVDGSLKLERDVVHSAAGSHGVEPELTVLGKNLRGEKWDVYMPY